jgi:carbon storage regulator
MLEITRKLGEAIIIGDNVRVEFVLFDTERQQVRLGIQAPREITVDREEIHERKQSGQEQPLRLEDREIDKIIVGILDRATVTQLLGSIERVAERNAVRRRSFWAIIQRIANKMIGQAKSAMVSEKP